MHVSAGVARRFAVHVRDWSGKDLRPNPAAAHLGVPRFLLASQTRSRSSGDMAMSLAAPVSEALVGVDETFASRCQVCSAERKVVREPGMRPTSPTARVGAHSLGFHEIERAAWWEDEIPPKEGK